MTALCRLLVRARELFRRDRLDRELHEELQHHRELLINDYQHRGMSPDEARRQATLTLGGLDQGREVVRDTRGLPPLEAFARDVRRAVRLLRKSPGFSAVTVLTLALGIGVNVAIFSIVDAVMLRPLPYPNADRLVSIWETSKGERITVAAGNLQDYQRAQSMAAVAALASQIRTLTGRGEPESLFAEEVTVNYFAVLGVPPVIGRSFTEADAHANSQRVVVLSDALWRRRFNGDPRILDQSITLDGDAYTVIGVMPPSFRGLFDLISQDPRDLWLPAVYAAELLANRGDHGLRTVGRLAEGVPVATARAEFAALSDALAAQFPETNGQVRAGVLPLRDDLVRNVRVPLLVLLATVGLILAITCVNVANLFLARGVGRRRDVALQFALGATRFRVATALMAESLVLASAAAIAGAVLAVWIQNLLLSFAPQTIPRLDAVTFDARVMGYAAAVALAAGVLFGLIPAWQTGHSRPGDALAGPGRAMAGSTVMRWRTALMIAQVALSGLLLVGAALMVKSLVRLNSVELGFDPNDVISVRVVLPPSRYPTAESRFQFFNALEQRVAALPDVRAVAFSNNTPLRGAWDSGFRIDGEPTPPEGSLQAGFQAVNPGYFATLDIRLAEGRLVEAADREGSPPVAVVSRMFERRFLSGRSAIGRQFRRGPQMPAISIVGVVDDVRRDGRLAAIEPQVYLPAAQTGIYPVRLMDLAVRTNPGAASVVPSIRAAVTALDPEQSISSVRTLEDILFASSADRRFQALLFSMFGLLALVLASGGTYGVVAYIVSQRTPEIGVRLALGASVWSIYRWLLTRTAVVVLIGAASGLLGARGLARYISTLLFDVTTGDAASYLSSGVLLVATALAASLVAGYRATKVDPVQALRYE